MNTDRAVRLLLIDDEPSIREVTQVTLESTGNWDVTLANSGEEGIAAAKTMRPDLILVDFMMPGLNGWETIAQLREVEILKSVPVVVFTARGIANEIEEVKRLGVAGVIKKPFEPLELGPQLLKFVAAAARGQ